MDRLGWDDALPKDFSSSTAYLLRFQLKDIEDLKLPRTIVSASRASYDKELHMFCDATTTACAAVVYLRQIFNDSFQTKTLTDKTTIAPIKSLRVPRLELCAAIVGANLLEAVISTLKDKRFRKPEV